MQLSELINRARSLRSTVIFVLIGAIVIVWGALETYGRILAIEPAISLLLQVLGVLSNPWVLAGTIVVLLAVAVYVWRTVDHFWMQVWGKYGALKTRFLPDDSPVVTGIIDHGDTYWKASYTENRQTTSPVRLCPFCQIDLTEQTITQRELDRPNTPVSADDRTYEQTTEFHENVYGTAKSTQTQHVRAFVCARDDCRFSIAAASQTKPDESAVTTQFREHFDRMAAGGSRPFRRWRSQAAEQTPDSPAPTDLWDAYVQETDADDALVSTQRFGGGLPGEQDSITCQALKDYRASATLHEQLLEKAPPGLDKILAGLFRSSYLVELERIHAEMDDQGEDCRAGLQQIETSYGSTVERVLAARYDREHPRCKLGPAQLELEEAAEDFATLSDSLDHDYLSVARTNWLHRTRHALENAQSYVTQLQQFESTRTVLTDRMDTFERRFTPYERGNDYMTSPDEAFLTDECADIRAELRDLHRELELDILPEEYEEWAAERQAHYNAFDDVLSDYNERFIEREKERFADLFETEHGPLNDAQQAAVIKNDRHNLVDASAGTGKTLTLTYRFLYLHRKGVPLDDIVAVTYTNDAVDEMRDRIRAALDIREDQKLHIYTYHQFAIELVGDAFETGSFDLDAPYEQFVERVFSGDVELMERHRETIQQFWDAHQRFLDVGGEFIEASRYAKSQQEYCVDKYSAFLENARTFALSPSDVRSNLDSTDPVQQAFCTAGSWLFEAFIADGESSPGPMDFTAILESAIEAGRNNPARFESMFQHILLDEFQDANYMTIQFVKRFLGETNDTRLFAVGDDWQSIFGFRGSTPSYFIEFEDYFEGVAKTQLEINYRCPPAIVQGGTQLMQYSEDELTSKSVRAASDRETEPTLHLLGGIYERRLPGKVVSLVERSLNDPAIHPGDVMILSSTDNASPFTDEIRDRLDERSIPSGSGAESVTVQTIHGSKGTEAPVVILANAREQTFNGLPKPHQDNRLLEPVIDNQSSHFGEERRLFYVAMTRATQQLHIVTEHGNVSRYIQDIDAYVSRKRSDQWDLTGMLGTWNNLEHGDSRPFEAMFFCDDFTIPLVAWETKHLKRLVPGTEYRITNIDPRNDGFGEQVVIDSSVQIEPITAPTATTESE